MCRTSTSGFTPPSIPKSFEMMNMAKSTTRMQEVLSSALNMILTALTPIREKMPGSWTTAILAVVLWCVLVIFWKIIYNHFFSPLRNIPGPFLAKITTKWLTINECLGIRSSLVARTHERYGPVIRIAPNELSFADRSCIKDLYMNGSKFPKSPRYEGFRASTAASFDMTDRGEHRERRPLVRHVLAPANIDDSEPIIGDMVRKSIRWVKRAEKDSLEIVLWTRRIMLDTAGALFLGQSFDALENEKQPEFLDDMDDFFNITALRWFAPWILTVLRLLPARSIQHFLKAQERSYVYGRKAFDGYIEQYGRNSGRIDLLTKMVGTTEDQPMTDEEISNELSSLLVGATDTTVVTATWMLWELAKRPEWQHMIRDELKKNSVPFHGGVPSYRHVKQLPILNGFIMESMRLHTTQSIGLPRIAGTDTASVGGFVLPKGTYVSVQSRTVHRDPEIYPSPHSFLPERWIDTNGGTKEMKDSFIIFSKGSRSCLGQYVAYMELKLVISMLMHGWELGVAKQTTDETMRQTDYFLAFPKDRVCWLTFQPLGEEKV